MGYSVDDECLESAMAAGRALIGTSAGIRVPELRPVEGLTTDALDWPLLLDLPPHSA